MNIQSKNIEYTSKGFFDNKEIVKSLISGKQFQNLIKDNEFAKVETKLKEIKSIENIDIYLNNKNHLINLNILNFVLNNKLKIKDFSLILKSILKSKTHKLSIDGKYLMENGMLQGALIGKVLKKVEEEWLKNDFKITKSRVKEIIKQFST